MIDQVSPSGPSASILDALDISAEPFALCELQGACRLGLGPDSGATIHYVLSGTGCVTVSGGRPIALAPGTLVLVPAGRGQSLRSDGIGAGAAPHCEAAELRLSHLVGQGPGPGRLIALCARVHVGLHGASGLIDLLIDPLAVAADEDPALGDSVGGLLRELAVPAPGGRAMVRALLLQCIVAMLRTRPESLGFLPLLSDPRLVRALRRMLDEPGAPHRVETLAEAAGMSRTRFALGFASAAGVTPAAFLRDLRLARAAALLAEGTLSVERVAARMGFASRSAFSRAFRDRYGYPPASLNRPCG